MIKNQKNIIALFLLLFSTALSALATIFTTIILAKYTTTEVFGNYSSILATIIILSPLCGFGIAQYWLKIFGQHGAYGVLWIKKSLIFVSISTLTIFISLSIWFIFISDSYYLTIASILLSLIVLKSVSTEIINSTLQIDGKYFFLALWQFFQSSIVLIIILCIIYFFNANINELTIAMVYFPIVIISIFISILLLNRFLKEKREKVNLRDLVQLRKKENPLVIKIFKESAPFGFAGLFSLIYSQLGVVFVRYIEGAAAAAVYSVALTFLSAAMLIPIVLYQKFLLPKLHRWVYHDKDKFERSYYLGNKIMLILGILSFLFLWILAPYIVNLFFGDRYFSSIHLVQIMAINIPIVYLASSAGSLLVTHNHMKVKVYYMGIASAITLILSTPMINYFGIVGAIYANIVSNTFILIIYFYKVKKDILNSNIEVKIK